MELIPNGEKNHPPAVALRHGGRRPAIHDFSACISKVMDADLRRHDGVRRGRRVGLYAGWYNTTFAYQAAHATYFLTPPGVGSICKAS